jgi:hypothetical protein
VDNTLFYDDLPSERVTGLGLGEWYGGLDHTSFILIFQRT